MASQTYRNSVLIRFSHCDPAGIVFYPRYVEIINNAIEDWMAEALEWPFSYLIVDRSDGFPTVSLSCNFLSPCRIGDTLELELTVLELGTSSCTLSVAGAVGSRVALNATLVLVYTHRSHTGEHSIAIPPALRKRIAQYA